MVYRSYVEGNVSLIRGGFFMFTFRFPFRICRLSVNGGGLFADYHRQTRVVFSLSQLCWGVHGIFQFER